MYSSKKFDKYEENKDNDLELDKITEEDLKIIQARAKKLSRCWNDAIEELKKVNAFIEDLLKKKKKPFDKSTEEELIERRNIVSSAVSIDVASNTMISTIKHLDGDDELYRSLGILSSGALQGQLDRILKELKERKIHANIAKLEEINTEVKEEMKNIENIEFDIE